MAWPPEEALVLVALLPQPRDLDIARTLGWYRIPVATAPRLLYVDYLAFYQPASFGPDHRWRIEYVARLLGHEMVTRRSLFRHEPDHPRADEWYYKMQLAPLERLPRPILAGKWKRVTFFYTLGAYFPQARTLNDLVLKGPDRDVVWKRLRTRHQAHQPEQPLPPAPPPEVWALLAGLSWPGAEEAGQQRARPS